VRRRQGTFRSAAAVFEPCLARRPTIATAGSARHDAAVDHGDHRRHPRGTVALATIVSPSRPGPVMGVIDVSEGGTCIEWTVPADLPAGSPVRLCFLLGEGNDIEIDGTVVRVGNGRAGIEFLPAQQALVRQLLAEVRSED
jgi:hypothetical protein